jgi:hypothetical protein
MGTVLGTVGVDIAGMAAGLRAQAESRRLQPAHNLAGPAEG